MSELNNTVCYKEEVFERFLTILYYYMIIVYIGFIIFAIHIISEKEKYKKKANALEQQLFSD
jgi:hypothetical protein